MCDNVYTYPYTLTGYGLYANTAPQTYKIDTDCYIPEVKNNTSKNRKHNVKELFKEINRIKLLLQKIDRKLT